MSALLGKHRCRPERKQDAFVTLVEYHSSNLHLSNAAVEPGPGLGAEGRRGQKK